MKKIVDKPIDILELSCEIELDSQSGALSARLLKQGHTLYSPDPATPNGLKRHLPSGNIELGYWRDGKFVVTAVNPERVSDK